MKRLDCIKVGDTFGMLTVIKTGLSRNNKSASLCRCVCGSHFLAINSRLLTGRSQSCGCKRLATVKKSQPRIGERFGRLVVLEPMIRKGRRYASRCKCDCGNEVVVLNNSLKSGNTTSCGCFHNEGVARITYSHGGTGTRLYNIWNGMRHRCTNKNNPCYPRYGGRGITVCDEWKNFEAFRDWALKNGYKDNLSIDRIDNDKGYSPSNCRWADDLTQANNKRRNLKVTIGGEKFSIKDIARIYGINEQTLRDRFHRGESNESILHGARPQAPVNSWQK